MIWVVEVGDLYDNTMEQRSAISLHHFIEKYGSVIIRPSTGPTKEYKDSRRFWGA